MAQENCVNDVIGDKQIQALASELFPNRVVQNPFYNITFVDYCGRNFGGFYIDSKDRKIRVCSYDSKDLNNAGLFKREIGNGFDLTDQFGKSYSEFRKI
jgi:hypothetical protein